MSRIPATRIGYSTDYTCSGADPVTPIPTAGCSRTSTTDDYYRLPNRFDSGCSDVPFVEEYKRLWDSQNSFRQNLKELDFTANPANGDYVNLYWGVRDAGFIHDPRILTSECFEPNPDDPCDNDGAYGTCSSDPAVPIIPFITSTDPLFPLPDNIPVLDIRCPAGYFTETDVTFEVGEVEGAELTVEGGLELMEGEDDDCVFRLVGDILFNLSVDCYEWEFNTTSLERMNVADDNKLYYYMVDTAYKFDCESKQLKKTTGRLTKFSAGDVGGGGGGGGGTGMVCQLTSGGSGGSHSCNIHANGKWEPATSAGSIDVLDLFLQSSVPSGTWVIGHTAQAAFAESF